MQGGFDARDAQGDVVTVLRSTGPELRKTWKADGTVSQYERAKYFNVREVRRVDGIDALSSLLLKLERSPHNCVVRGRWRGAAVSREKDPEHRDGLTRRLTELFEDVRHHWVLVEVDRYRPTLYDPVLEPEEACLEYIEAALPECFHGVSFHWQLSNSAGRENNRGVLKAHLWFWLERAYNSDELREWATAGRIDLDRSVLNAVQVHYTSAPGFDAGVADPVPLRSGLYRGVLGDTVPLVISEEVLSAVANRALRVTGRAGEPVDLGLLSQMVYALDADMGYQDWIKVGQAIHLETGGGPEGLALWDDWSARGSKYTEGLCAEKWDTFRSDGERLVGRGTLERMANAAGWVEDVTGEMAPLPEARAEVRAEVVGPVEVALPPLQRTPATRANPARPQAVFNNLLLVLERPDVCGYEIAFDEFIAEPVYREPGAPEWSRMTNGLSGLLQKALEAPEREHGPVMHFMPISVPLLDRAIMHVAQEHRFDSAQDWLYALPPWDGVQRVGRLFIDHCHAVVARDEGVTEEYLMSVSQYMLSALAGRIANPGVKADIVPILIGPQGCRKSSLARALAPFPGGFEEVHLHGVDQVDTSRLLRGCSVAEVSELRGFGVKEEESVKAFFTRQEESFVEKYEKFKQVYPRRCVFIGTTNSEEFLNDATGSRRYAPVMVGHGGPIDVDWVLENHAQLWAEGLALYQAHGVMYRDVERYQDTVNARHEVTEPWVEPFEAWLNGELDIDEGGGDGRRRGDGAFTLGALLSGALHMPLSQQHSGIARRAAGILRKMGYERAREGRTGRKRWTRKK